MYRFYLILGALVTLGFHSVATPTAVSGQTVLCLLCDEIPLTDSTGISYQHRFDSSGDVYRECLDDDIGFASFDLNGSRLDPEDHEDCHNNAEDGACESPHPPCGSGGSLLIAMKEEISLLLRGAEDRASEAFPALLLTRISEIPYVSASADFDTIALSDCNGDVVYQWEPSTSVVAEFQRLKKITE